MHAPFLNLNHIWFLNLNQAVKFWAIDIHSLSKKNAELKWEWDTAQVKQAIRKINQVWEQYSCFFIYVDLISFYRKIILMNIFITWDIHVKLSIKVIPAQLPIHFSVLVKVFSNYRLFTDIIFKDVLVTKKTLKTLKCVIFPKTELIVCHSNIYLKCEKSDYRILWKYT